MGVRVLIALDDSVLADEVHGILEAGGQRSERALPLEATPDRGPPPAVVLVDPDGSDFDLGVFVAAWTRIVAPPVILIYTADADRHDAARAAGATVLTKPMSAERLADEIGSAAEVSHVTPLPRLRAGRGAFTATAAGALAALGLAAGGLPEDEAAAILAGSRKVGLDVVREALRPLRSQYLTPTALLDPLCARRALTETEARFATRKLDGAHTVRALIDRGGFGQEPAARLLWALVSGGAALASPEPDPDGPHALGRLCARTRKWLRARYLRVRGETPLGVLELDDDASREQIEHAALALSLRLAPDRTDTMDLSDLAALAQALWQQVIDARTTLAGPQARDAYEAFRGRTSDTERAARRGERAEAEEIFVRGQQALAAGDSFRAMSELAAAARRCPTDPEFDVWAAWARVLAERARGGAPKLEAARARAGAEEALAGRRPTARSLLPLAYLCEVAGDTDFARYHYEEVLALDPRQALARDGLERLG